MQLKDYKRLSAGVSLRNSPEGLIVVQAEDYDGGSFGLLPKISDESIYLVDVNRPTGYGLAITGTPEALDRLGKALQALSRQIASGGNAAGDETNSEV